MARPTSECEKNDWFWNQFKNETDIEQWQPQKFGNKRIGVALLGIGRIGMHHLCNIMRLPRAKLLYCLDADQARLDACSRSTLFKEFAIKALHIDKYELVLQDPKVHAIIIATPTFAHEQQARRALEASKCVMCEKPLTPHTEGILELYELAKEKKCFLLSAFNRRYDPDYRDLYTKVRAGEAGTTQLVKLTARDCEPPPLSYIKVSPGLFHDTCIHDLDALLWLVRQLPSELQVIGKSWKEFYESDPSEFEQMSAEDRALLPQIDDFFWALITLKFPNGSLGLIDNGRQATHGYDQRCEVFGSRALLKLDHRHAIGVTKLDSNGVQLPTVTYGNCSRFSAAYTNEVRDLLNMAELAQDPKLGADHVAARAHLLEAVRPSLVAATAKIADACMVAAKSKRTYQFEWPEEFVAQFKRDIEL